MNLSKSFFLNPISGIDCVRFFDSVSSDNKHWILREIETLTDQDSTSLGDLYRKTQSAPMLVTTSEISNALSNATQIIALDLRSVENHWICFVVVDGELVEYCAHT